MDTERIGLFGGTFAPPHLGHVRAVKLFLSCIPVDRLLVMPTAIPPHKQKVSGDTPEARLSMCRAAFSDIPKVTVSSYEIDKGGVSYTVETLRDLTKENRELFMLCGGDMFRSLPTWFCADEIFRLTTVVGIPRDEGEMKILEVLRDEYTAKYGAKIMLIGENPLVLSSTEIRKRIRDNEALDDILPSGVISIIREKGLYRE